MCKLLIVIGVFLVAVQLSKAQVSRNETNICTGMQPNVDRISDVTNCDRYIMCSTHGVPFLVHCPMGQQFNATTLRCAPQHEVRCFACPTDVVFIDLPVDRRCDQFIRCFAGVARQDSCSQDLLFDPARNQCNLRKDVTCPCPQEDIPARPYFIRKWDKDHCRAYAVCHNGTRTKGECAKGLNFNLETLQCDVASHVDCNAFPSTAF